MAQLAADGTSDEAILRAALFGLHPGLLRYNRPGAIEAAIAQFGASVRARRELSARFLALSRVAGLIQCGHTHVNFVNQSRAVDQALFRARTRLPFFFRWVGREMIVTDGQASGLPLGTEVLTINNVDVRTILSAMMPLARADGSNDEKRRRLLSVEGEHRIETFDVYHPLLFPFADERATLTIRTPHGERRTVRLACLDLAERQAARGSAQVDRAANPGWTLEHRGHAAVMTMADWAMYNRTWDWRGWIAAAFEEMARRRTATLILDLRANEGGNDCGDEILARMIDAPLQGEMFERRVRYRQAPHELVPYLDTWDRSFDRIGVDGVDIGGGYYRLPLDEELRRIAPKGPRFRGRLFVLIGPQNSSATFHFANLVRASGLGTLIGETTGGNRRGINGSGYYFLRLPESGLEMDIPLVGKFPATPQPDAGAEPDIHAPDNKADIAAGRDPAMAAALRLAAG